MQAVENGSPASLRSADFASTYDKVRLLFDFARLASETLLNSLKTAILLIVREKKRWQISTT
jgi:hypothetical protein